MASLHNDRRSLRFRLSLCDRETPMRMPGQPPPAQPPPAKVLGDFGIEHFDRRDQSWWPFIHQAVFWMAQADAEGLVHSLEALIRGESPGFAFRSTLAEDLALQVGRGEDGRVSVEVGLDLNRFLIENAGVYGAPGEALSLFRFVTTQPDLVAFAHELKSDLQTLIDVQKPG